ncbi:MAG: hypothetical protein GF315_05455 [candidate division Zixibacteria bacterium]|nr:hypothetical protein [candidate division Zixibacteria bacterium]
MSGNPDEIEGRHISRLKMGIYKQQTGSVLREPVWYRRPPPNGGYV